MSNHSFRMHCYATGIFMLSSNRPLIRLSASRDRPSGVPGNFSTGCLNKDSKQHKCGEDAGEFRVDMVLFREMDMRAAQASTGQHQGTTLKRCLGSVLDSPPWVLP